MRPVDPGSPRGTRRAGALLLALTAVALAAWPGPALGDGDPASDTLLTQDVYYPYQPTVSLAFTTALTETVDRAKRAGFPVKVALIAGPDDLGSIPFLFGHPGRYAEFLDQEISFNAPVKLIVVMPQGLGEASAGPAKALRGIIVNRDGGSDALAGAAISAIVALTAAAGHPILPPAIPAATTPGLPRPRHPKGSASSAWVLPLVVALGLFGVVAWLLRRRRRLRTRARVAR